MNRAGLTPLAVNGFTLYEREGCSTAQWRSLSWSANPARQASKTLGGSAGTASGWLATPTPRN
jgi:hypothetical protein